MTDYRHPTSERRLERLARGVPEDRINDIIELAQASEINRKLRTKRMEPPMWQIIREYLGEIGLASKYEIPIVYLDS
ncbi:hypothetical protein COU60_01635 [Candidatus Pacearchaeota archaeon CG10_big_fil_rev_8_21_14_0_10_34_76]|nr:MAG: hypothetical protein COU60_01635 [Candidatus Pacearchaeota archaeon CG10_big_fil_rev_8_21_14_0_10_34_76]